MVGIPLIAAWVWEIIRVRDYNRHAPPVVGLDWTEPEFWPILVLFVLNWVTGSLWQYIVLYFLGALTNSPTKSANYAVHLTNHSMLILKYLTTDVGRFPRFSRCRRSDMFRS